MCENAWAGNKLSATDAAWHGALALLFWLGCALLAGCSGGAAGLAGPGADADEASALLSAPAELLRTAAGSADSQVDGADFNPAWPHARVSRDGGRGRFTPVCAGAPVLRNMAYAVYRFQFSGVAPEPGLLLDWDTAPPVENLWIALSDWGNARWAWLPVTTASRLEVPELARYLDGAGNLLVVAALAGHDIATLSSLTVEGELAPGPGAWPQQFHDAQNNCCSELTGPATETVKWSVYGNYSGLILAEDNIMLARSLDKCVALDSQGGRLWESESLGDHLCDPVIGQSGTIYLLSRAGTVYALKPGGALDWSLDLEVSINDHFVLGPDDTLYISASGGQASELIAVSATGEAQWRTPVAQPYISPPTLGRNGLVYICASGSLLAYSASGAAAWTCPLQDDGSATPVAGFNGTIYSKLGDTLYAVSPAGSLLWSYTGGDALTQPVVGADGSIYLTRYPGEVLCLTQAGSEKWVYATGGSKESFYSATLDAQGTLYALKGGDLLLAIAADGNLKWSKHLAAAASGNPVIGPSATMLVTGNSVLTCLGFDEAAIYPPYRLAASRGEFAGQVRLDWQWVGGGQAPDGYLIYRSLRRDSGYALLADAGPATTYLDTSAAPDMLYFYRATCYSGNQESAPCDPVAGYRTPSGDFGEWPTFMHDAQHTGRSPRLGPVTSAVKWTSAEAGALIYGSPVIDNSGNIYSGLGTVTALDGGGALLWSSTGNSSTGDGGLALGLGGAIITAQRMLNPDGTESCSLENGGFVCWSVISPQAMVYSLNTINLWAYYPHGAIEWELELFQDFAMIFSCPALAPDGTLYLSAGDNRVHAVNPDGSIKWTYLMGAGPTYSGCAVAPDGTVYVGNNDRNLYAINPDGTEKWKYLTGGTIATTPAVGADGAAYVGSFDGKFYCVEPGGSPRWVFNAGGGFHSSAALDAAGRVYVGCDNKKVYCLDASGTELWSYETGGAVKSSPAIGADGTVYVYSGDGLLYAFGPGA